jgi:coenzyme F420-reducing hydrogenase gamma subunit
MMAVHKFSSCDGCQLAILNLGEDLLALAELVDIAHFAEAGVVNPEAKVNISFVEGSISSQEDIDRINRIRVNSEYLVTIGACATSGGIQSLRNLSDGATWMADIYASPTYIDSLDKVTPIARHVKVDQELWGCPVNSQQVLTSIRSFLNGTSARPLTEKVCMECKRQQHVCVLVAKGKPCLGPVTVSGCGALCPRFGRDCYGCYGPSETPNAEALGKRFSGLGLVSSDIVRRFEFIHSQTDEFLKAADYWHQDND